MNVCRQVDDLESIDALEQYIDASQVIQMFCSKGYFQSRNCLREVRSTLDKGKRFCLMHDPEKGGATLEAVKQECPDEIRSRIFDEQGIIEWRRIRDFQMVSLQLLGEVVLLGSPVYQNETALPLYMPGDITSKNWAFRPPITVYCSPNNPGCEKNTEALRLTLMSLRQGTSSGSLRSEDSKTKSGESSGGGTETSTATRDLTKAVGMLSSAEFDPGLSISTSIRGGLGALKPSHMILYLNDQTFVGEAGERLADEVRNARKAGTPIVMLHQNDPEDGGCEVPPAAPLLPAAEPHIRASPTCSSSAERAASSGVAVWAILCEHTSRSHPRRPVQGARPRVVSSSVQQGLVLSRRTCAWRH